MADHVLSHTAGHEPAHGHEHDVPKQQNMAIWLGLCALTFFYATFVASNVYLRGWSPAKFAMKQLQIHNLPYLALLDLIACFIVMLVAGSYFKKKRWQALNRSLAVLGLLFVLYALFQFWIIGMFAAMSPQIWTAYMPAGVMQFLLAVTCIVYIGWVGWRSTLKDKTLLMRTFPLGMNFWMYTVISSVVVYLLTDVMTVGSIAQWCGMHLY